MPEVSVKFAEAQPIPGSSSIKVHLRHALQSLDGLAFQVGGGRPAAVLRDHIWLTKKGRGRSSRPIEVLRIMLLVPPLSRRWSLRNPGCPGEPPHLLDLLSQGLNRPAVPSGLIHRRLDQGLFLREDLVDPLIQRMIRYQSGDDDPPGLPDAT